MSIPETLNVKTFLSSTDFYLAAGTVTVDPVERKVLILQDLETKTYQLPRGRKDWGESLAETAVRETFEESGFRPRLLPVPLSTRATAPGAAASDASHPYHAAVRSAKFDETGALLVPGSAHLPEEPIAIMQHYQNNGALSVVLWYVGVADSHSERQLGTQMADEEYEPLWAEYEEATRLITDKAYADVVRSALYLVERVMEEGAHVVMALMYPEGKVNGVSVKETVTDANELFGPQPRPDGISTSVAEAEATISEKTGCPRMTLVSQGQHEQRATQAFLSKKLGSQPEVAVSETSSVVGL